MDDYREFVRQAAAEEAGEALFNRNCEHAAIILETVASKATVSLDIVTGHLNPNVFGKPELVNEVVAALRHHPHLQIRVLAEEQIPPDHPLLEGLGAVGLLARVEIRYLPGPAEFHCAIADGRHFRFEGDPSKFEAIVYFGNSEEGKALVEAFDAMWAETEPANSFPGF